MPIATFERRPHQPGEADFRVIHAEDIEWTTLPGYPPAVRLAILEGDPSKPGPYTVRVRLPAGTRMEPHRHPEDRLYTVISGIFYIGLGDKFDEAKLTAHPPGAVIILPGGQPHFHWAKSGEYVTQVTALGPLGLSYMNPADDPREQAGRAATAS